MVGWTGSLWRLLLSWGIGMTLLCQPAGTVRADETVIRIAALFALSGPAQPSNEPSLEGVRWAVREINAAGGVLGRELSLIEIDNLSTPIGSKVAADEAVRLGVAAIIGPAWSSHAIAVAKVAQLNRIPMVSNISTHPDLTAIGNYIFRVCFNDRLQGRALAVFAGNHLKARSAVISFDMTSDYSIGLSNSFQAAFERFGGRVTGRIPYKPRQSNFRHIAAMVKQLDPDILFVPGYDESGSIAADAAGMGVRAIPIGGDGWDVESFLRNGGDRLAKGYFTTHWSPAIQTPRSRSFVDRYGTRATLTAPAALGYDAVHLLADAISRAGTTKAEPLRDAIAATKNFEGVTGRISFVSSGDPDKPLVIMEIKDGRPQYLMQVGDL